MIVRGDECPHLYTYTRLLTDFGTHFIATQNIATYTSRFLMIFHSFQAFIKVKVNVEYKIENLLIEFSNNTNILIIL